MRRTWTWRGAVVGAMAVLAGSLAVGHTLAGGIAQAATAPTVERYNPYVSGNRLVFTQVQRAADGSTTAGVWARDLTTGTESLVADVATGEPMPVTSDTWTAWSDSPADGRVAVHARANRGGPILDLFATDQTPNFPHPDYTVPVALSGSELTAVNGYPVDRQLPELVRFTLPSARPSFVDVMSTAYFTTRASIAQAGRSTAVSEGNGVLFSIVDQRGRVIAAPSTLSTGCTDNTIHDPEDIAFDGTRVGLITTCGTTFGFGISVATCTLPCATVDVIDLPPSKFSFGFRNVTGLTLANGRFYFMADTSFVDTAVQSSIFSLTPEPGAVPQLVWSTGDVIGHRLSASGNRLVWDQSGYHGGSMSAEIYQRDLTTGTVSVLRPTGEQRLTVPNMLRHDPDISGDAIVFAEAALDGTTAGIWTRSITGSATLVSSVATDTSAPLIRDGVIAWATRDPAYNMERVFATRGQNSPLIDVFSTNLKNVGTDFAAGINMPVTLDLAGNGRVIINAAEDVVESYGFCCAFPTVRQRAFDRRVPNGSLAPIGQVAEDVGSTQYQGRGEAGYSVAQVNTFASAGPHLYDRRGNDQALSSPSVSSPPFGTLPCRGSVIDISSTDVVSAVNCFADNTAWLASCDLPCPDGLNNAIQLPNEPSSFDSSLAFPPSVEALTTFGSRVAVRTLRLGSAGRYGTRIVVGHALTVYDLAHAQDPPIAVMVESGTMSTPHIDRNRMVFGVTSGAAPSAIGTLYLFDLRTRTLSTL